MKIVFKVAGFYFVIIALSINTFKLASASEASISKDSNMPVCTDNSRLMEIYQWCIDTSGTDTNIDLNDINIAVESLNNMIAECHQDEHYVRMVRASCFMKKNKLSEALSDYQFVLSSRLPSYFVHREIGSIYLKQGKYEDAIQEFTIEINKEPNSYQDYIYRARAYKESGNLVSALSDYRSSLKLLNERTDSKITCESCYSPVEVDIYLEMGSLLEQDSDVQEVISLYKEGLENNPRSLELQNKLNK